MPLTGEQFGQLQAALADAFNAGELARLARVKLGRRLDLMVPPDLPLPDAVFRLLDYAERRGWTDELVRGAFEENPTNVPLRAYCEAHARFVFAPRPSTADLTRAVGTGLAVVAERLADEGVRGALTDGVRGQLAALSERFARVRRYKVLHDALHQLQFKYERQVTDRLRLLRAAAETADRGYNPRGPVRWLKSPPPEIDPADRDAAAEELTILLGEMADDMARARAEVPALPTAAAETAWLNRTDQAIGKLRAAGGGDAAAGDTGLRLLDGVLRTQPTRINELLAEVLEHLGLETLLAALTRVREAVPEPQAGRLATAAAATGTLGARVSRVLSDHKDWQVIDNGLVQIETDLLLGGPADLCAVLWAEVDRVLRPQLDRDPAAAWAVELRRMADAFAAALAANAAPAQLQAVYAPLCPRARWRFYQIDRALKDVSDELARVGERLDLIVA